MKPEANKKKAPTPVGSGDLLDCVLDWLIICLNVMVLDIPQIVLCLDAISLLLILFFHDALNLAVLEENLLLLNLYALGTILYKMLGNPCRQNRGWHASDNRDDAIKSLVVRDRAVVNLATQWCHRNALRRCAGWLNVFRIKKVNSDFHTHKNLDERKQPNVVREPSRTHDAQQPKT